MNPKPFMVIVATSTSLLIGALTAIFPSHGPVSQAAPTSAPAQAPRSLQEPPNWATPTVTAPTPTCDDYGRLAIEAGWTADLLPTLLDIMWAESRCKADAVGDIQHGGSLGLMQIHTRTWCEPNKYWPLGYLQTMSVLDRCHTLLDPYVNLYAALLIYREGGWQQWTTYKGN